MYYARNLFRLLGIFNLTKIFFYLEEHEFEFLVRQRRVVVLVLHRVLEDALAVEVRREIDLATLLAPTLVTQRAAPFIERLFALKIYSRI